MCRHLRILFGSTLVLGTALSLAAGCKQMATTDAGTATGADATKGDGGDTPNKPAPVAGAYLACVITKPTDPQTVEAGCQVRDPQARRFQDGTVSKGSWTYVAPPGTPASSYTVSLASLSAIPGHKYYFHVAFKIHLNKPSTSLRLTGASPSLSLVDPALDQVLRGFMPVYRNTGAKALTGLDLMTSTRLATGNLFKPTDPNRVLYAQPAAVVNTPNGVASVINGSAIGAPVDPGASAYQAIDAVSIPPDAPVAPPAIPSSVITQATTDGQSQDADAIFIDWPSQDPSTNTVGTTDSPDTYDPTTDAFDPSGTNTSTAASFCDQSGIASADTAHGLTPAEQACVVAFTNPSELPTDLTASTSLCTLPTTAEFAAAPDQTIELVVLKSSPYFGCQPPATDTGTATATASGLTGYGP